MYYTSDYRIVYYALLQHTFIMGKIKNKRFYIVYIHNIMALSPIEFHPNVLKSYKLGGGHRELNLAEIFSSYRIAISATYC